MVLASRLKKMKMGENKVSLVRVESRVQVQTDFRPSRERKQRDEFWV
jgi:hypothetical protein